MDLKRAWQQCCISCRLHCSEAPYCMSNQQHPARQYRPPHRVHDTACARAPGPRRLATAPAAAPCPPPSPSSHHARLLASSAPTPRLPPPAAPPLSARPSPSAAGFWTDVWCFNVAANNWTLLSPSGTGPSPRNFNGFTATPDGMLYVFGGSYDGNEREGRGAAAVDGACRVGCIGILKMYWKFEMALSNCRSCVILNVVIFC
jgi:hypothetical protein